MLRKETKQLSFYSVLYDKIPQGHMLRKVECARIGAEKANSGTVVNATLSK